MAIITGQRPQQNRVEDAVIFVTDDEVLDLAFFLCDHLYHNGFVSTSNRIEKLLDSLLVDFGRS